MYRKMVLTRRVESRTDSAPEEWVNGFLDGKCEDRGPPFFLGENDFRASNAGWDAQLGSLCHGVYTQFF